jgi:carbon-monoxide dehydrogenase medium subunit
MFVKPFAYERAGTFADACERLRAYGGEAKAVAGGQSLLPMINLGLVEPRAVVDISHVEGGRGIALDDGSLRIGALTRHLDLERDPLIARGQPLLRAAASLVGNRRVRALGTLGGSLAHADPAAELPLAMTVLDAEYCVTDGRSRRTLRAHEFPITFFTTQLEEAELLEWVRVPALGPGWGWGFVEVSRRSGDFAIVAAAALAHARDGILFESRLAVAGVGDRPIRLPAVEAAGAGASVDELEGRIGPIEDIEPVSDGIASSEYRRHLARVLVLRALSDACRRAGGQT